MAIWLPAFRAARIAIFSIGCIRVSQRMLKNEKAGGSIPKQIKKGSGYFLCA
ncbi:Uncharacterised protein [Vibrio cholerae]|nr:Uncharacterised protein [Vibrio cholerae]